MTSATPVEVSALTTGNDECSPASHRGRIGSPRSQHRQLRQSKRLGYRPTRGQLSVKLNLQLPRWLIAYVPERADRRRHTGEKKAVRNARDHSASTLGDVERAASRQD